jgi:hypothetical protein
VSGAAAGLAIGIGITLIVITSVSVLRTLVVPRGLISRLSLLVDRGLHRLFRMASRRAHTYTAKDRILTYEGPLRLLGYLALWLAILLMAFSLIFWPFVGSFPGAIAAAGSSMFTLGFVPVSGPVPYAAAFLAAAAGLSVVALEIAYLPSIYGAFNRREMLVTMLSSRAGSPPWGPEVLARHALIGNLGDMAQFFRDWELWAADLAESHTNYPVLLAFRSPEPMRSWVVALNAMLDAAALYLTLAPRSAPSQANSFIRMGYVSLREIATVLRIDFDPDPLPEDPIELSYEEFRAAADMLDEAGFPREVSPHDAWAQFHGWRVNYEALVYDIANRTTAPPGLWSGYRDGLTGVLFAPERPRHRHPGEEESHVHSAGQ